MNYDPFEEQLRAVMRRQPAPPDFTRKVMERTARKPRLLPWALAAGLVLGVLCPSLVFERRRAKAEQAKHDLIAALNITSAKLRHARESIQRHAGRI